MDLSSLTWDQTQAPCSGSTTREVPYTPSDNLSGLARPLSSQPCLSSVPPIYVIRPSHPEATPVINPHTPRLLTIPYSALQVPGETVPPNTSPDPQVTPRSPHYKPHNSQGGYSENMVVDPTSFIDST